MKKEKIICIVSVIMLALVVSYYSRNGKEPFVDLNVDVTLSDELVNTGLDVCGLVLPKQTFITRRNHGRCLNPRVSDEIRNHGSCVPVHLSSRDIDGGFYQRGLLKREGENSESDESEVLPLYQRKNPFHFKRNYYYTTDDRFRPLKYSVVHDNVSCQQDGKGCREFNNKELVFVPELNAQYRVELCSQKWEYEQKSLDKVSSTCKPLYFPDRYYTHNPPVIMGLDW